MQMTEREFIKLVDQQFENTAGMVEGFFSTIGQMAQVWGAHFVSDPLYLEAVANSDKERIIKQIIELQKASTADVVIWLDQYGKVVYDSFDPSRIGRSLLTWSIVRKSITDRESGSGIISDLGNFIIFSSTPMIIGAPQNETLKGIALVGYVINDTLLQQIKRDTEIDITIVRRRAVMASTYNNLQQRLATIPLSYLEYQMLIKEQKHLSHLTIDGVSYLAEADPLEMMNPTMEGSIMLTYPKAPLNVIKDHLITGFSTVAVIGFLFALFISMRLASGILAPLRQLLAFSERAVPVTGSTHSSSERIHISDRDEVGALANHFNHLIDTLEIRNRELEIAKELAESANRAKSEFIANIGHELRTPLHAILSFSSLGSNKLDAANLEKLGSYFDNIKISGERLHYLIEELMDLSIIEIGNANLNLQENDLLKVISDAIRKEQDLFEQHKLSIQLIPMTHSAMACFDPIRIDKVITNLLSNAVKYSSDGQTIELSVSNTTINDDKTAALLFSIKDRGIGIPETEIETIFDKFVQSSDTKTGAGGTGLGLAICKAIINEHGGEIWANNREGGGAALHFTIPIKAR